ncbi:hypothetical protein C8R44DRAFT_728991 [Mycena epipterygia]|nr:hypothetical protein C8R44DRAFT_728991 [Mycena epipterygia]
MAFPSPCCNTFLYPGHSHHSVTLGASTAGANVNARKQQLADKSARKAAATVKQLDILSELTLGSLEETSQLRFGSNVHVPLRDAFQSAINWKASHTGTWTFEQNLSCEVSSKDPKLNKPENKPEHGA